MITHATPEVDFDKGEYRQELKDALADYDRLGLRFVVSEGKNPGGAMGDGWQNQKLTVEQAEAAIDRCSHPCIGVQLGEIVDCDVDGAEEQAAYSELFEGVDGIFAPTADTGRDGGTRQLWATDPRIAQLDTATIKYKSRGGNSEVTIRTGGGEKGAYSVLPPSRHASRPDQFSPWHWTGRRYRWRDGLDLESVGVPKLPEIVVERLLAAHRAKHAKAAATANGVHAIALAAMLTATKKQEDGHDGSKRMITCSCRAVEHNLTDAEAVTTIRAYATQKPFPREWTDAEIVQRVRDAEGMTTRGSAVVIANFSEIEVEAESLLSDGSDREPGAEAETKTITVPKPMSEIIADISKLTGNWPRRVDNMLFVDDPTHGLDYFDRRTTAGLFGWLRRRAQVKWSKGGSYVAQAELFAEIERTATRYDGIEVLPHEPPIAGLYYRGARPSPGKGKHLAWLLDRFRPETTIDRDLLQAAFMTLVWGGGPGRRPAFVITSDHGRGVGKTTVAEMAGRLTGGYVDVSAGEDIETLKTRLLSPAARTHRVALLDNVKTLRLSWAELESLITAPMISGRQLFVGEGQRPNLLTWFITLNGVSLATDMAQRSVIIKLVRGENHGTWHDETTRYIDDHRQEIIGDLITALQSERYELATYSRWATWEKDVLCRLPEPGEAQKVILERQGEANCELDEAEIIEQHFAEKLAELAYDPETCQVRIPVATAAFWFSKAIGEQTKTAAASKRINQMASEGAMTRLAADKSRAHGRGFIWTGPHANVFGDTIDNSLPSRLEDYLNRHSRDGRDAWDG